MTDKQKIRLIKRFIENNYLQNDGTIWHYEMAFIYNILCLDFKY